MARMIAIATLVYIGAALLPGQVPKQSGNPHDRAEDEAIVKTIVDHWRQAWERFDASVLQEDYAEDADWLNAFGVTKSGGADIVAYVAQQVKRSNLQGRRTTWGEIRVRFVRGDIATAYRDYQTLGHKTRMGANWRSVVRMRIGSWSKKPGVAYWAPYHFG